ncbi:MAG: hypothetical protein G01um101433_140 [Parcubacteria group bacterium Gr01-1014_33]|nr:MAG: hypothetical protein G01um101433_140 [Parcubacteria group bacterium Gr01-1014_33]
MAKSLTDILVTKGIIDLAEAASSQSEAKEKNAAIDEILYQHGVAETDVAEAKSALTGYPTKYLEGKEIPFELLRDIPEDAARFYHMAPLGREEGYFDVGMLMPENVAAQEALKFIASRTNLPLRVFIITPADFQNILREYQSLSGEVSKVLGQFEQEGAELKTAFPHGEEDASKIVEDAPVTKIVAVTIRHAVEGRASDIHIESSRDRVRIRFRVDGVLHTSLTLPRSVHPALVSRIKVMANLKIDETRVPQDGRFHISILGRDIDFRVSTLPTSFGEKVVIRILDPSGGVSSLTDLGLEGRNLELLEQNIKRPYGMILITGPTGSGKSTTLYAILKVINQEGVNIVSLEDPIEYYVSGVNQSQIRPEIGYDFANGLRHILRQDPDVILVGEIRDKETASLAIHAALTGHLVLSTLHTNNALGVIPRLIDMGIDPFLIAPTLILAVGQRLTRRLCIESRAKVKLTDKIKEFIMQEIEAMPGELSNKLKKSLPQEIYQAATSSSCPKGTRGRIGIFEVMSMTPELEQIILSAPAESKIQEEAKRQNMVSMRQDGILKVLKGEIGIHELLETV